MNVIKQDKANNSRHKSGLEGQISPTHKTPKQSSEMQRQMDEVFEKQFKHFAALVILGVTLAAFRIKDTGFLISYPIQWICTLGMVLIVVMRQKISFQNRNSLFYFFGLIFGSTGIFTYGILGQGLLILLYLCIMITLSKRISYGYIFIGISMIIVIIAGIGFQQGVFALAVNPANYAVSLRAWGVAILTLLTLSFFSIRTFGEVKELWFKNIKRVEISESKYRELTDSLPQVVFETSIDGNIIYANRIAFDLFGYSKQEMDQGLSVLQLIIPADRKRAMGNIQRIFKGEILGGQEYTVQRKDGSTLPILIHTNRIVRENITVGMRGIIIDLSKRKQVEEALRESEEFSSSLLEHSPNAILVFNPDTSIRYVNTLFEKLTGYTSKEVLGKKIPFPWWVDDPAYGTVEQREKEWELLLG